MLKIYNTYTNKKEQFKPIHTHVFMYVSVYVRMHMSADVRTCVRTCVCICVHMYVSVCMYVCLYDRYTYRQMQRVEYTRQVCVILLK